MIIEIEKELNSHLETMHSVISDMKQEIAKASKLVIETLNNGGKILLFGNGGSAADAQHISAEIVGRYKIERRGLPAIALTTDTSSLTAIGNDYGYQSIFSRQIEALANKNDLLIGISTSGNSENVILGLKRGKEIGCSTLGFSGKGGGNMIQFCDINLIVPSDNTPRIQEMHILFGHIISQMVDNQFSS